MAAQNDHSSLKGICRSLEARVREIRISTLALGEACKRVYDTRPHLGRASDNCGSEWGPSRLTSIEGPEMQEPGKSGGQELWLKSPP